MTFENWLLTDAGKRSTNDTHQPILNPYLRNRLYHAYYAGVASGEINSHLNAVIQSQTKQIFRHKREIRALKKLLKKSS